MTMIYGICAAIIGIAVCFRLLNWLAARTYKPGRDEIADKLRKVLDGSMTIYEWDEFICVPIGHDEKLNSIREKCAELEIDEFCHRQNAEEQDQWIYNESGLAVIRMLLSELET